MKFTKNYSPEIAALIGEMIDGNYPADFLTKHHMRLEVTERTDDEQIITLWLGKGKAERQYSICSWRDNRFSWHHTIFGSLAELPSARQKVLHQELEVIVAARIEEELSGETTTRKPRTKRENKTGTTPRKKRTAASEPQVSTRKRTNTKDAKETGSSDQGAENKGSSGTGTAAAKNKSTSRKTTTKKEEAAAA